jgi:predicted  nucleic acid-binding Zn-ribbon protein
MMARCAKCQQVFEAGRYGRQFCPHCGSELMLAPPARSPQSRPSPPLSGGAFTPPPPGPPAGDGLQDQSTPWEQRSQLGFFPALFETVKRSATDPVNSASPVPRMLGVYNPSGRADRARRPPR